MTTSQLARLNRDIDILYRYQRGDMVKSIAKLHNVDRRQVRRIAKNAGEKLLTAVEIRKREEERKMDRECYS